MNEDTALTPITQAQRMLAEAKTLDELKSLRDYATGAKAWAKARGLGIETENEAAEVVLRAERGIGSMLSELEKLKLYGPGAALAGSKRGARADQRHGGSAPVIERRPGVITNEDLGIRSQEAIDFKLAALVPEDKFEAMLREVRAHVKRLAKVNFYRAGRREKGLPERPTPEDKGFITFRAGAHQLLGWEVDGEGNGKASRNGLLTLPVDELVQVAHLVKALAEAYNQAREVRDAQ